MNANITIENCTGDEAPEPDSIQRWVEAALTNHRENTELGIRIVDAAESAVLNERYRGKQGPTNVLSFAADLPDFIPLPLLGDLVICAPLVLQEALAQGKHPNAHWAHLVVHGTLHLLGYDHTTEQEAKIMEALEADILAHLDFPPPYEPPCEPPCETGQQATSARIDTRE